MSPAHIDPQQLRILILAPLGRDAELARAALATAGLTSVCCRNADEVCRFMAEGAGAALFTEEALEPPHVQCLLEVLKGQPAWSDFPIVVFGGGTTTHFRAELAQQTLDQLRALGTVTVLERPVHAMTMVSAMQSALRARRRQYEVRDLLQQLEDGVRQRDEFLAMLGHELRNPLAAISGANYVLDQMLETDAQTIAVRGIIDRQTKHLARLVDDLLDVSRVTKGKITLQRQSIDLNEIARRCGEAIENAAKAQHHTLKLSIAARPLMVDGDPARLEQILSNLLTNAVKYTPANGFIELSTLRDGNEAVLCVRDSGIGIAPELLPQVFDLFSQAQSTLDRSQGGLGIGLTVVRGLVEMHGGEVHARSEGLGKGSEFEVSLPLIEVSDEQQPADGELSVEPVNSRQCVLVVEDNADARDVLCFLLRQWGYDVATAGDGPDGIEKAVTLRPDAAIVDIGLPQLSGYEVARRIRGQVGADIYLIALTGYGQPDDQARALEAGFDVHMVKPIEPAHLSQLLASLSEPLVTGAPQQSAIA